MEDPRFPRDYKREHGDKHWDWKGNIAVVILAGIVGWIIVGLIEIVRAIF